MRQQHPHDVTDLRLAPVALLVDGRLEPLPQLHVRHRAVGGSTIADLGSHLIDLAGWRVTWDPRGVRLTHHDHSLVLGVSRRLADFVAGTPSKA